MYENSEKIRRNCCFLKCNGTWGMLIFENIVVINETTHCELIQDNKRVSQFKYTLTKFTKVSCTFMRNKGLKLLNLRRKNLQTSLYLYFISFQLRNMLHDSQELTTKSL